MRQIRISFVYAGKIRASRLVGRADYGVTWNGPNVFVSVSFRPVIGSILPGARVNEYWVLSVEPLSYPEAFALIYVTRYDKSMKKATRRRGRPRKVNTLTAAERMRAYRKRKRDAGLKNVRRWEPAEGVRQYSDHRILDARSLAMHCKIAQKISRDPDLLDKARANLERWSAKSEDPLPQYLHDWQEILKRPWPEIAEIITSMSDDATRLRSTSPFAGILTADERDQIYAAFRA